MNDVKIFFDSISGDIAPVLWSNVKMGASGYSSHNTSRHFSPPLIPVNQSWTKATFMGLNIQNLERGRKYVYSGFGQNHNICLEKQESMDYSTLFLASLFIGGYIGISTMAYDLDTYRSWFPHIQTGKIWLNHAAISPVSKRVSYAVTNHLNDRSFGNIDVYPAVIETCTKAKKNLATLINTTPDRIGFVLNTSDGLSILANGLDWKTGDRILLNDVEFPANIVPFMNLKNLGVEIDFVKSRNGEISVDEIEQAITPRTKLLSISFVQFLSGFKADLSAIGDVCKRRNVIFCVDSIQGLGAAPLDVQKSQIDFLSNGGNKWLMGMMGTGFVYVSTETQERIHQKHIGWTSNKNFFGDFFRYRLDLDETARRYENGTQNYIGITALQGSTTTLLEVGIDNIHAHLLALTDRIISFCDSNGFELVSPRDRTKRAGIISMRHPDAKTIFDDLNEQRIVVSLREGILRIAPHFYNSEEDLHALFSILHYYSKVTQ